MSSPGYFTTDILLVSATRPLTRCIFGRTGLRVSEVILGTMTFGDRWGEFGASPEACREMFDAYVERGGNAIDTANVYIGGQSEEI